MGPISCAYTVYEWYFLNRKQNELYCKPIDIIVYGWVYAITKQASNTKNDQWYANNNNNHKLYFKF